MVFRIAKQYDTKYNWLYTMFRKQEVMSRLYHSLECYTWVYTTRDYGITYLFRDRCARAYMGLCLLR